MAVIHKKYDSLSTPDLNDEDVREFDSIIAHAREANKEYQERRRRRGLT